MAAETTESGAEDAFRARVVEGGYVSPEQVEDAYARFTRAAPRRSSFGSFMLQEGLLSLTQLVDLAKDLPPRRDGSDPADVTPVAPPEPVDELIGQVFSGYRVEELLGAGGMGSVYLSRRLEDGALGVVKFLASSLVPNATLRERFRREGEALQRVGAHPNVVQILHVAGAGERPHLVMEYVEGLSLLRVLQERWSLPQREALRIARDIARGLAAIHAAKIVHRDIKPANVILTEGGEVKIVDFGLAKDLFRTALTQPGQLLGSPCYMAPEMWGDEEVDARADVFALGATLYHLLVGEPPFTGATARAVGQRILSGEFTPASRVVPGLAREVDLVLHQMLHPDRRLRYARVADCAEDLDRVLAERPSRVPALVLGGPADEVQARFPLLPGTSFVVGRDPDCEVHVPQRSVSRRHARVERQAGGYVLEDLQSTFGTYLGEERLTRAAPLRHGDRLRLGRVQLTFSDPCTAGREDVVPSADVEHAEVPGPAFEALVAQRDPRVALTLIERLAPDRFAARRAEEVVRALLGQETASRMALQREQLEARERTRTLARLAALGGTGRIVELADDSPTGDLNRDELVNGVAELAQVVL